MFVVVFSCESLEFWKSLVLKVQQQTYVLSQHSRHLSCLDSKHRSCLNSRPLSNCPPQLLASRTLTLVPQSCCQHFCNFGISPLGSMCIEYAHEAQVVIMGATKKKNKTPLPPPPPPICVICDRPLSYYIPTNPRFWRIRPQITHLSCWVKWRRRHRRELGGAWWLLHSDSTTDDRSLWLLWG